jgi:hypothetical protein
LSCRAFLTRASRSFLYGSFSAAFGLFRLLKPMVFDRYFASHGSLPEVLRQGFEVKKIMLPNLELSARFRTQEIVF